VVSEAEDKDTLTVSKETAEQYGLKSVSDLEPVADPRPNSRTHTWRSDMSRCDELQSRAPVRGQLEGCLPMLT